MVTKWGDYIPIVLAIIILCVVLAGIGGLFRIGGPGGEAGELKCNFPGMVCNFGIAIGIPEGWLRTDTFIWYMIIPIAGIWMIIYGFLDRIKIFKSSISAVLAMFIAFSMIPLGLFVLIVSTIFSFIGIYSVFIFFGLFVVGTYLYSKGLIGAWRGVYGGYEKAISAQDAIVAKAQGDIAKLQAEMMDAQKGVGKYVGVGAADRERMMQNTIGPRLLDAQKKLAAAEAQKKFLQDQEKRVKKTFQLEEKA